MANKQLIWSIGSGFAMKYFSFSFEKVKYVDINLNIFCQYINGIVRRLTKMHMYENNEKWQRYKPSKNKLSRKKNKNDLSGETKSEAF